MIAFSSCRGRGLSFFIGLGSKESRTLDQMMTAMKILKSNDLFFPIACSAEGFHTSPSSNVNHRKKRAIVRHLNYINHEKTLKHSYEPLVTLPDYTYLDGRPTEIMLSQKEREEKNYQLAKQMVQLVGEMKFAQQELQNQVQAREDHMQKRQQSSLKHKEQELT